MQAPTILEPLLLSSIPLVDRPHTKNSLRAALQATPSSSRNAGHSLVALGSAYRVASKGSLKRSRAYTTYVTCDGGVAVMDVEMQTVTSSVSFSTLLNPTTPPLVYHDAHSQLILLALQSRTDDQTTELHAWSEDRGQDSQVAPADATQRQNRHHTIAIPSDVVALHPLSSSEILAQRKSGRVSIVSFVSLQKPQLTVTAESAEPATANSQTLFAATFDRAASRFILQKRQSSSDSPLALLVDVSCPLAEAPARNQVESDKSRKGRRKSAMEVIDDAEGLSGGKTVTEGNALTFSFASIEPASETTSDNRIRRLGSTNLKSKGSGGFSSVSIHASGRVVALSRSGLLTVGRLGCDVTGAPVLSGIATIQLDGFATGAPQSSTNTSLLSVSPTTALLVKTTNTESSTAATPSSISMLLIDVEIQAVLAETVWNAPSPSYDFGQVFLVRSGGSAVSILISPESLGRGKAQAYILHASFETSEGAHLRWSLAKRSLSQRWIKQARESTSIVQPDSGDDAPESRQDLLRELRTLARSSDKPKDRAISMEKAFDRWYDSLKQSQLATQLASQHLQAAREAGESQREEDRPEQSANDLPASFISDLLAIVVPSVADGKQTLYPKAILAKLLQDDSIQSVVYASSSHLLTQLAAIGDWAGVETVFGVTDDLVEEDLVGLIKTVIDNEAGSAPSLERTLSLIVNAKYSSEELRKAMHKHLETKHVERILTVLQSWLVYDAAQPLLRIDLDAADSDDLQRQKLQQAPKPPLLGALTLTIDFMDTFFPLILSTKSLEGPLVDLSKNVQAQMARLTSLGILRGPLAAFAKVEEDREREAEALLAETLAMLEDEQGEDEMEYESDEEQRADQLWAKGRRAAMGGKAARPAAGANATMQIGAGLHSRSGQREKTRRQQAYADRMTVGLYALERFDP